VINGDELTIKIPAYREDMENYPDIAEELIRMYGYDHVKPTFLKNANVTMGGRNLRQKTELRLKRALCSQGAFECMHYSFFSPSDLDLLRFPEDAAERNAIKILNPINEDLSLMRTTLAAQMIHAIARNQKKGTLEGRLFEVGNRFVPKSLPLTEYPEEKATLCIGIFGEDEDIFTLKGLAENVAAALHVSFKYETTTKTFLHPYRAAKILCEGEEVGYLGQITYEIQDDTDMRIPAYVCEIDLSLLEKMYGKTPVFQPLSKFATVKRDLALVMDKTVTCGEVEDTIYGACKYVTDVKLFDVYEGLPIPPTKKSMAFTITFTPKDEELTDEAINGYVDKMLRKLSFTMGIEIRS
jgi:phenylalanyl-tRNA synthetase beta chain